MDPDSARLARAGIEAVWTRVRAAQAFALGSSSGNPSSVADPYGGKTQSAAQRLAESVAARHCADIRLDRGPTGDPGVVRGPGQSLARTVENALEPPLARKRTQKTRRQIVNGARQFTLVPQGPILVLYRATEGIASARPMTPSAR